MKVVHCTWKLLFDGERNQTFDSKRFKYIKGNISDEGNMQIFSSWVGFSSIPRVSHKGSGGGGDCPHLVGATIFWHFW